MIFSHELRLVSAAGQTWIINFSTSTPEEAAQIVQQLIDHAVKTTEFEEVEVDHQVLRIH